MESTTKKLIARAIGTITIFKPLQVFSVTTFPYCDSLPRNYEHPFLVAFLFWRSGLSLFRKHVLPDFSSNYFQKNHP
jgi:hypothetical protein